MCIDPSVYVGLIRKLDADILRDINVVGDNRDSLKTPPLSPKHIRPTPPFRSRPSPEEIVLFASCPRGGSNGTIAYLCKAVVRLVQNSVENEGVCYVS